MIKSLFSYLFPRKAYGDVVAPLRRIVADLTALQADNYRDIKAASEEICELETLIAVREVEANQALHTQQKIEALLD